LVFVKQADMESLAVQVTLDFFFSARSTPQKTEIYSNLSPSVLALALVPVLDPFLVPASVLVLAPSLDLAFLDPVVLASLYLYLVQASLAFLFQVLAFLYLFVLDPFLDRLEIQEDLVLHQEMLWILVHLYLYLVLVPVLGLGPFLDLALVDHLALVDLAFVPFVLPSFHRLSFLFLLEEFFLLFQQVLDLLGPVWDYPV
jgi:hypothetical protein